MTDEAPWEQHTRGIGSRLMQRMGYVPGTGRAPIEPPIVEKGMGLGYLSAKSMKRSPKPPVSMADPLPDDPPPLFLPLPDRNRSYLERFRARVSREQIASNERSRLLNAIDCCVSESKEYLKHTKRQKKRVIREEKVTSLLPSLFKSAILWPTELYHGNFDHFYDLLDSLHSAGVEKVDISAFVSHVLLPPLRRSLAAGWTANDSVSIIFCLDSLEKWVDIGSIVSQLCVPRILQLLNSWSVNDPPLTDWAISWANFLAPDTALIDTGLKRALNEMIRVLGPEHEQCVNCFQSIQKIAPQSVVENSVIPSLCDALGKLLIDDKSDTSINRWSGLVEDDVLSHVLDTSYLQPGIALLDSAMDNNDELDWIEVRNWYIRWSQPVRELLHLDIVRLRLIEALDVINDAMDRVDRDV